MFLVMYFPEIYDLNSDLVLCFVVDSFVDLTKSSFTYFLLYAVFTNVVAREVLFHRAELVVGKAQSMVARLSLCFCHLFMICLPCKPVNYCQIAVDLTFTAKFFTPSTCVIEQN